MMTPSALAEQSRFSLSAEQRQRLRQEAKHLKQWLAVALLTISLAYSADQKASADGGGDGTPLPPACASGIWHPVLAGENLMGILDDTAALYNLDLSVEELQALAQATAQENNLADPDIIQPGQQLCLPTEITTLAVETLPAPAAVPETDNRAFDPLAATPTGVPTTSAQAVASAERSSANQTSEHEENEGIDDVEAVVVATLIAFSIWAAIRFWPYLKEAGSESP